MPHKIITPAPDSDLRYLLTLAKDWGCIYKDLAKQASIPYWRFLAWKDDGRDDFLSPEAERSLALLAEAYIADQKRAVDLVVGNALGIAATLSLPESTVKSWREKMHVPQRWLETVLEKGPGAPRKTPNPDLVESRRRWGRNAANARWGDMGPWQRVVFNRIVDAPSRAYLTALAEDLCVPQQYISQPLSRLLRRGHIKVVGFEKSGGIPRKGGRKMRKMYGPAQKETPTETGGRG